MSAIYKHAEVIDADGYRITFVVVHFEQWYVDDEWKTVETLQSHTLKEGESLIYDGCEIANSMTKPRWNFDSEIWEETATPEEIEAARPEQVEQIDAPPSNAELANQNLMLMEATAELYEQNIALQEQNLQVMEAVAEVYEMILGGVEND